MQSGVSGQSDGRARGRASWRLGPAPTSAGAAGPPSCPAAGRQRTGGVQPSQLGAGGSEDRTPGLNFEGCRSLSKSSIFLIIKKTCVFSVEIVSTWVFCLSVFYKICVYDIIGIKLYLLFSNLPFALNTILRSFSIIKYFSVM